MARSLSQMVAALFGKLCEVSLALAIRSGWSMRSGDRLARRLGMALGLPELNRRLDEAERELVTARTASRNKGDLLMKLSHEIRAPMTAIQGYADLLADHALPGENRVAYVASIRRNSDQLLAILEGVLDLAQIEAGKMNVSGVACSPAAIAADVASLMGVAAIEKKLAFGLSCSTPIPETITGDPTRLRQILLKLVGNAIRFTEQGGVTVELSLVTTPTTQLCFSVRDTGVGLTPDQIAQLVRASTISSEAETVPFGGRGLGLAICQRLAALMGGRIAVTGAPGHGACFTLIVPTGPIGAVRRLAWLEKDSVGGSRERSGTNTGVLESVRVLLAEDGHDSQRLISTQLQRAGASPEIVRNGLLAVFAVLQAEADGQPYDVVLMDMQMPELDGCSATARLRALGYRRPILALTVHAMADDQERCLLAGCDDYLTKPIDRARLVETVAAWAHRADLSATDPGVSKRRLPATVAREPLRSALSDDPEMAELVAEFVQHLAARAEGIRAAQSARDSAALRQLAHQLKGAAGGYGFDPIGEAAAVLEEAIQESRPHEDVEALSSALLHLCWRASLAA